MINTELNEKLEFLILFFSLPDKSFYESVYRGHTPLGKIETELDCESFCSEMMTEASDLFVNSKNNKVLHPIASQHIEDRLKRKMLPLKLSDTYMEFDKMVSGYPSDHLKVIYEFLLYCLENDKSDYAVKFHHEFLLNWTNIFTDAILNRKPGIMFIKIAGLINFINTEFETVK